MKSVDERIVDMQFNNKQFESGIQTSIKSLDMLKKALNLKDTTKDLNELQRISNNFSLEGMANGIEYLRQRFSNLGIIGLSVINNLTNAALNAGERIVSALTIDPIKTGLS